jgi:hypothetical protein
MGFIDRLFGQAAVLGPSVQGVEFAVTGVTPATTALEEIPYRDAVGCLLTKRPSRWAEPEASAPAHRPIEACSRYHGKLVAGVAFHPVVAAIHLAYHDHRPLILSPDAVWLLIAQGFANHVNANAEEMRPQLVSHAGKATIIVRRNDFFKGSPENPWAEVFDEFSTCIRGHLGAQTHDLLLPTFSTTGAVERAAAQVVLLDAMQSYFSYEVHTYCGIPRIGLEGTVEDWQRLAERVRGFERFGLGWWVSALGPILDEFVQAARGEATASFWKVIYKQENGSGGPFTSGWITAFFPYFKHRQTGTASLPNPWLQQGGDRLRELLHPSDKPRHGFPHGPTTEVFPSGLARAPFLWKYFEQEFPMEFLGGFVGVRQDADSLALRPEIGWAIRGA